ncbi:adenylate/guanylate cyclase domain-containing protein [Mesorhizobium sp. LHD-90]|uniref:adenylate/guanylate cyclase domain-containing protein n=1 Tax=Mesorhizobium sp. LHD-90 TaxID=3071414 RepID=UPI0027DFB0C6|nr:adenylate/guanylate cyclase domain-containing protein [Mesorhizobium sp. LHD-90]MDQ6438236.1 adenylate/guanylate cyclase domain-containing protein [Mesorhizobium sp. LHD-90]
MSEINALFSLLRNAGDPKVAEAIETLVTQGSDRQLCRVNALAFAERNGLDEERAIAGLLHAASIGIFDISWNVLCPGCGGVLDSNATLKTVARDEYVCSLCAEGYSPTLDEMVEVTFTVSPRVRRIAAHSPEELPLLEYLRQLYWGSGVDLPEDDYAETIESMVLEHVEIPAGEKVVLSLQLPSEFIIVFESVTHSVQFIDVKGEPTRERQNLSLVYDREHVGSQTLEMRPGPVRIAIENRSGKRVLPAVFIAGDPLHHLLARRRPFLTAKRLLTNQTFRDLHRTDTVAVDQRLKITSLTFLFTDLRGSTELYERVGDLNAFDMVREHFRVLQDIVAAEAGAVVKTIGDAVMATFPTPDRAVAAALRMREAMQALNQKSGREDLLLKIGVHEGPCIAVMMNDQQDYFGQTVNIASRVQGLATAQSIFVTGVVMENENSAGILKARQLTPVSQDMSLRGIEREVRIYAIP